MMFNIENEDQRCKARLVIGGHKADSNNCNTHSSQADNVSVALPFLLVAQHIVFNTTTCNVSNIFVTAPNSGQWQAMNLTTRCGLAGSARSFTDFLTDTPIRPGFKPSCADPDLWIKETECGCDCMDTHVDDAMDTAEKPQECRSQIRHNIEHDPKYFLGSRLTKRPDGKVLMNLEEHCKEAMRQHKKKHDITLKKENIPTPAESHPEMDASETPNEDEHRDYQHDIGAGQWPVIEGRIVITHAISSPSRFSICPRRGHLKSARKTLECQKKFPKKEIVINPTPPKIRECPQEPEEVFEVFGHQCQCFKEELDPNSQSTLSKS